MTVLMSFLQQTLQSLQGLTRNVGDNCKGKYLNKLKALNWFLLLMPNNQAGKGKWNTMAFTFRILFLIQARQVETQKYHLMTVWYIKQNSQSHPKLI